LDCSSSDQLVALLRDLDYEVRKPYSSPSEAHHVNFTSDPGPVVTAPHPVDDVVTELPPLEVFEDLELEPVEAEVEEAAAAPVPSAAADAPVEDVDASLAAVADEPGEDDAAAEAAADSEEEAFAAPLEDDVLGEEFVPPELGDAAALTISEPAMQGIDVSVYQGDINWEKVRRAGYRFAFVRATIGASAADNDRSFGPGRLSAMKEAGIVRGYYHAGFPSGGDALTEARHAVKTVKDAGGLTKGDLPLVLDLETTSLGPTATSKWASHFCREVHRLTGHGCILYTGPSFWKTKAGDPARPPAHGVVLWIAHYGVATPSVPRAWGHRGWNFWQYTERGSCPGVHGKVDLNHWYGSLAAFNALLID